MNLALSALLLCHLCHTSLSCPLGNWQWNGNCYFFSLNLMKWAEAETFCADGNGHLTSIESGIESNFLLDVLSDVDSSNSFDNIWIGGDNLVDGTTWQWSDGKLFLYTNWKPGFPTNAQLNQCVAMEKVNGFWSNENCHQLKRFMCKLSTGGMSVSTPNSSPTPPTEQCPACPDGYEIRQGFCYRVFRVPALITWYDARTACIQEGGDLASIHSIEENRFILGLLLPQAITFTGTCNGDPHMWIGVWDPQQNGHYVWADGTNVTLLNWSSGNPNNNVCGAVIHCGLMFFDTAGLWGSRPCNNPYRNAYYACKLRTH